jgi:protein CpxP
MSLLRSSRLALVALSGLLMAGTTGVALAQPLAMMAAAQGGGGGGRRGGVTLDALTTRLKLTPDQQEKIKPILADRDTQMTALRGDQSASQDDRRAKMMKIRTDTNDKINAVLTPDQQAEFKKMNDEMAARMAGGGGGAPAPPQ